MELKRLLVIAGAGRYPQLIIEGARRAGVACIDVMAIKGSYARATARAADRVHPIAIGSISEGIRWAGGQGYDGAIMAGQVNPLALFRGRFDAEVRSWLAELQVKNAHTIFRKLIGKFEEAGVRMLPASLFMEEFIPGEGALTERGLTAGEADDVRRGIEVAADVGRHDVGQTVMVKSGMVLAVEAFEGTDAAIKRGGRLGGAGGVVFKAAREGHDMRFDIPVVGMRTLKTMRRAGARALAYQAGRLIMLDRDEVLAYANRHAIAIVGIESGMPHAPVRP